MKPKSTLRSILSLAGSSVLAISYTQAATLHWDGDTVNGGNPAASANGGNGNWDNALTNWDSLAAAGADIAWTAGDTAVFGGAVGTVTLTDNVSVGGLQFNTNSYIIDGETNTNTLSFADGNNTILTNGVIAATINGQVGGSASANVTLSNAAGHYQNSLATLTLGLTSTSGWAGSTTINAGTTLSLSGANLGLASTSGITLNGGFATVSFQGVLTGGILLTNTNATQAAFNRVNDSAPIVSNGGSITVTNTASGSTVYSEDMGALDLRNGQLNVTQTNANSNDAATQTLTFGSGSLTTVNGLARTNATTSAINFSGASLGANVRNTINIAGQGDTNQNEIIAPWATVGTTTSPTAMTDYAVYNRATSADASTNTLGIQTAAIAASAESNWSTAYAATSNYTLTNASNSGANGRLASTYNINTLRNTTAAGGAITVNTGTDYVTRAGNAFADGDVVVLSATAGGLTAATAYYVRDYNGDAANGFKLAATQGGPAIDITAANTSTITGGITLSTGNALNTYGILNGGNAPLVIGGAANVSTPSGGGNLFINTGGTSNSSSIVINSVIADNGGAVTVVKSGAGGHLTLSGDNTFTGGLVVNSGSSGLGVRLLGTQSFTGGITLNGGGIGEVAVNNNVGVAAEALNNNAITVNGPSHLLFVNGGSLGTGSTITINAAGVLSIGSNGTTGITVNGVVSGSGLLDAGNLNGNVASTVILANTANTFTGNVIYAHQHNKALAVSVNSIGDSGKVTLGSSGFGASNIFNLHSTAASGLTFNTRQFELGVAAPSINNRIGNNSAQAFTINTDLLTSGTGTSTLQLYGTGAGLGTFAGKLANGSFTSVGITKAEAGTWALTNTANSYTGLTTITAGALEVTTLADGGSNSSIGASTGAGSLILNGGTLRYKGGAVSTNRNFALTASSSIDASGSDAVNFSQTGSVSPDQNLTANFATGQKVVTGLSSTADLVVGMRVTGTGIAANSTIASINSSSQITLNNNTTSAESGVSLAFGYTASARTLTLTGTNTGANTIAGILQNTTAVTTGVLNLTKAGIGTWVLSNANTYTGTTTAGGGLLKLNNANALPGGTGGSGTSNLTITGGGIVGLTANSGNFTRGLGTGVTHVQWTGTGGGFAAYGGDRTVNLGGAGATAQWNTGSFVPGAQSLILSAADSDATLIWENPINFAGSPRTIQANNGSAAVDARLNGALSGGTSSGLNKTGTGTLEITNSSNSYSGATTVSNGTLRLGASDVLPDTTNITIAAAMLDVGAGFTDTVGTLDVSAAATINLGSGATLVFADSNGEDWTGGSLNITGAFVSGSSIKFATSGGLDPVTQLANITLNGSPTSFSLDGSGFLVSSGGPVGFAAWQAANGTLGGRDQDHDGDGVDNGTEHFIYGTVANSGFTPLPGVTNTLGTLSVTWTKSTGYTGNYGTDYQVETSDTLTGAWNPETVGGTVTITGPNSEFVTYTFPNPLGTKKFARLRVTGP